MRLVKFALAVVLLSQVCHGSTKQALISTTNLLLPPMPGISLPLRMSRGCWILSSIETTNSAASANLIHADEDIVEVTPIHTALDDKHCEDPNAVEDELDPECFREFRVQVRDSATVRLGSEVLIFVPRSDPDTPVDFAKMEMRVDVRVAAIAQLEILTTTKRIEIGEKEVLQVIARDADANVFSTVTGLDFHWKVLAAGTEFVTMSSLSDANILPDPNTILIDKSKQSLVGLSTGRAMVHVRLGDEETLTAKVELIVSRTVSVCPGSTVGLLPGSTLVSMFCLRKIGCFASSKEFIAKRTSRDMYEWKDNPIEYPNPGSYIVQVEDQKEPTNKAFSHIYVAPLVDVSLFIAPASNDSPTKDLDECPFAKSKGMSWPPISRQLPPQAHFRTPTDAVENIFLLIKNKPYVLLPLALLDSSLKDNAPMYAAPFSHEAFNLTFEEGSETNPTRTGHAVLITPKKSGEFFVDVNFREITSGYTLKVVDEITLIPSGPFVMTVQCEMQVKIKGGSGQYRTRFRGHGAELSNVTRLVSKSEVSSPSRFLAWDELDESNVASVEVLVVSKPTGFKFTQGEKIEVVVGSTFTLDVVGLYHEHTMVCCSLTSLPVMVDESNLLHHKSNFNTQPEFCYSATFEAVKVGSTRVRFNNILSIEVVVIPSLVLDPPSLIMALGDEAHVNILGGSESAKVFYKQDWIKNRVFVVRCDTEGAFSYDFTTEQTKPDVSVRKRKSMSVTFKLECLPVARCELNLIADDGPFRAGFVKNETQVALEVSLFAANDKLLRYPSGTAQVQYTMNNQALQHPKHISLTSPAAIFNAQVLSQTFRVECDRKVSVREPMRVISPPMASVWMWLNDVCPRRVLLQGGSKSFLVSSSPSFVFMFKNGVEKDDKVMFEDHLLWMVPSRQEETTAELVIEDANYYPPTQHNLVVSLQPVLSLNIAQSPSFVVQQSKVTVTILPLRQFHHHNEEFDWSSYDDRFVRLNWEPKEAFVLIERPVLNEFVLRASTQFEGRGVFSAMLCSSCDASVCVESRREPFVVEKHRSVVMLPGSVFDLTSMSCFHHVLASCRLMSHASNLQVFPNGTLMSLSSCDISNDTSKIQVGCVSSKHDEEVYFDVFVEMPSIVDVFPFHPSMEWTVSQTKTVQIQAKLKFLHTPTCQLGGTDRLFLSSPFSTTFDVVMMDDSSRVLKRISVLSTTGAFASELVLPFLAVFQVQVIARTSEHACLSKQHVLASDNIQVRTIPDTFKVLSPSFVLAPPAARYLIQTSMQEQTKCESKCLTLVGPCLVETSSPLDEPCVVSVLYKQMKWFITMQVSPIGGFRASLASDRSLQVEVFDSFHRLFTVGWFDASSVKRLIEFEPSKHVQVEMKEKYVYSSLFQVNMTIPNATAGMKVSTTAKKSLSHLKLSFKETEERDSRLLGVVVLDRLERKCDRTFLGYFCVDGMELFVLVGLAMSALIAMVQGYSNAELYVFLGIVAVYFAAF